MLSLRTAASAVILLASLLPSHPLHASGTGPITLEQARSLVLEKNHDIAKAKEYGRYVLGRYEEERAAALPQLGLSAWAAMQKDESQQAVYGTPVKRQYQQAADITLSQPLFTWGKIGAAIRAAEVGMKTAETQLSLYRQAAVRDVTIAFLDVLLAKELEKLARQNLEQKMRHQDEARKKLVAGVATDYDVLAADVAVENARPEVIRSANQLAVARERLRFLLPGSSSDIDASGILDVHQSDPPSYENSLSKALSSRPELSETELRLKVYEELITIAEADDKPRLDLKGAAGWRHLDVETARDDGMAWNLGVYLSFPFFDGFRTSGRVRQAKSDFSTKRIEQMKLRDSIALEVRTALNSLSESGTILSAIAGTVTLSERLLGMAEKGFEFGVKNRLEVEDAQYSRNLALTNLARAKRDYLAAKANLDWATGANP